MNNERVCSAATRNKQHEEDGEENDGNSASTETLNASERCPICLNILTLEVGFPEECRHAFCVSCILKWSETSTSCPVDRKPFRAIYKTDSFGSWTKISVKERRPRENLNCVCDQKLTYCTKGKLCFRIGVKEESSEIVTPHKATECLDHKEKPEIKVASLSCPNCLTGGIIAAYPFNPSETTPCCNNRTEQEEREVCLIRRKREVLKHLRIPLGAEGFQCSTVLADVLIHPPSSLDEYILPSNPISFRSKDYSKRMCVHTGVQEGTEKKQAASGTSTSRGTRKKSVQSSTRRRSTRNSKSEASNLQSSPKSSSSDHEAPGYNTTTTTNTSSSGPPSKQPAKQRKQAPKKGTQTRKRLRSATQSQKGSKDKDNSESEPEQEKKCKRSEDDLSETELYKMNQSPNNINEKEGHHAQMSSPEQSEEKLDSSPAHNVLSVDEERSASPDVNNDHPLPLEQSSPSPVFKNGENDLEDKVDLPSGMDSAENSLEIEEKHSWEPENLNVSHGESSLSPDSVKHITSDHTDMPLLSCDKVEESVSSPPSHTQIKSPTKHLADMLSSESVDDDEENTLHTSQGNLQANESHFENMESSSIQSPLPPELEKECDLDDIPSPDASEEQSIQKLEKVQLEPNSLKTANSQVEQKSILEVNLQAENQEKHIEEQDTKTSISSESDHQHTSDDLVNRVEFLQQSLARSKDSAAEELSDTGEIQGSRLCSKLESPKLEEGNIHDMDGKIDLQNDHQKVFCEDNIEPVAMECDSVCSDHNDLEVEQPVNVTEPVKTESDDLASNKVPPSPPKQSLPLGDAQKKESRTRRSRFHSPSTTWSPSKNEVKERPRSRSRSKVRDSPVKCKSRSHSREKDGERSHSGQWKGRSRDRHHRRHSRSRSRQSRSRSRHSRSRSRHSKSKSRSRSRSGSHTRYKNKSVTIDRNERDCSSPPWKERHSNENWKSPRGSEKYRRNELDRHDHFRNEKYDARDSAEAYPDNKNDYPDWVIEKMKSADSRGRGDTWMRGESRGRGDRGWNDGRGRGDRSRGRGDFRGRGDSRGRGDRGRGGNRGRGSHWEDSQYGSGDSWNRNVNMDWNSPRSRGGRGRGGFRGAFNYGDQNENWNSRQPYSGNSNTSGQESSRFPESKMKLKYEDSFDSPADRSGWSSASSWAVRKTLPADVQNYYSKRGRNSTGAQGGVWPKQEESQEQDQTTKDQASQQNESTPVPVNMVQTPMNVVQQPIAPPPPQPMNLFPYSVGVHPPPLVNIQHNPYLPPPLPIHLHPALPLVQVSAPSSVPPVLPPPPPPPPPSQHISYITPQQDGKPLQGHPGASYVSNNVSAPLLPAPAPVQGTVGVVLGPNSVSVATTGHSKNSHTPIKPAPRKESVTVEASADSSKKEKKILIQERAAQEVKGAIKPYYQNKDITKDEYKEIVKKAVDKVCHSKSGEVDSAKVANLVKAYVDKYKHSRKKGNDDKL
ncbi:protein SCAF11 isoform X2 [Eleutherodactylus coqui]|uniref:protein SCAF11 isoform X2 n=1 Tax=Eleutherodactylus coqui TaxID=57060 RepID=UPI003462F4C7